jgi:hypothetical protein
MSSCEADYSFRAFFVPKTPPIFDMQVSFLAMLCKADHLPPMMLLRK